MFFAMLDPFFEEQQVFIRLFFSFIYKNFPGGLAVCAAGFCDQHCAGVFSHTWDHLEDQETVIAAAYRKYG